MTTDETTQPAEVLHTWRDEHGRVDIDAVRSGMVAVEHSDAILAALLDEVEQLRASQAKLLAYYNRNIGSLVDQLDTVTTWIAQAPVLDGIEVEPNIDATGGVR